MHVVEMLKDAPAFIGGYLRNTEKRKGSMESSTWALSNFLKEVNQSKENTPATKNCSGKLLMSEVCVMVFFTFCS